MGLAAVAGLILLGLYVRTRIRELTSQTHCSITRADLAAIETALNRFAADHNGVYPRDWQELLARPDGEPRYLHGYERPPEDPWGQAYIYMPLDGGARFRLLCLASDGALGGEGDAQDLILESKSRER